jgi:hypothetical protein
VDVTNLENATVDFGLCIRDGGGRQKNQFGTLAPYETARIAMIANPNIAVGSYYEMLYIPNPYPGTRAYKCLTFPVSLSDIREIGVFIRPRNTQVSFLVDNFRTLPNVNMPQFLAGIVDQFGQYTRADWPGKVHNENELLEQHAEEMDWLANTTDSPEFGPYGGWQRGAKLTATGYFRTRAYRREHLFNWLPTPDDPLVDHYKDDPDYRKTMNFYTANIQRKFGAKWTNPWLDLTQTRLRRWGFNTLAYGSDHLFNGASRTPYTVGIRTLGGPGAVVYPGLIYYGMPDPYDSRYKGFVSTQIAAFTNKIKNDPYLIGYFIDNELPWSNRTERDDHTLMVRDICNKDASSSPAKNAFVATIMQKYGTTMRLNAAWGTNFTSMSQVFRPFAVKMPMTLALEKDLRDFLYAFAVKYFSTIRTELRKLDANHLYLGCRFDVWAPEVLRAASLYQDVISFNSYTADVTQPSFRYPDGHNFWNDLNRPVMVGEMHFTGTDRGLFGLGLYPGQREEGMSPQFLPTQADRVQGYKNFMRSAFSHPSVVGVHWHRYNDDMVSGRAGGGLNANIGFVNVVDEPYWDFILPVREFNFDMYRRRNAGY